MLRTWNRCLFNTYEEIHLFSLALFIQGGFSADHIHTVTHIHTWKLQNTTTVWFAKQLLGLRW